MGTAWEEDDTLAVDVILNTEKVEITGLHVRFRDDIDYQGLPRGKTFEIDDDIIFVVIPSTSWNAVRKTLHGTLDKERLRRFGIGRSYVIPQEDIVHKIWPDKNLARFLLKMTIELDDYDFVNEVRWTNPEAIDAEKYPFVVQTQGCWNNYQHFLDEFEIRDKLREQAGYPLAIPVKKKQVSRIKHDAFYKLKKKVETS